MAHIQDRWYKTVRHPDGTTERVKTILFGKGDRYRLRYLDPNGREKSESFPDRQKKRAEDRLVEIESDKRRGTYVDPAGGKMMFKRYADELFAAASWDQTTADRIEYEFRLHVFPKLGQLSLMAASQPSSIRTWIGYIRDKGLAVGYQRVLFHDVSMVFNAAVDDKKIPSNPFAAKTIRPPRAQPTKVVPWTQEQRMKCRVSLASRYRIVIDLGAGCGLRQGEVFAVSPDDIDPVRPILHVVRQIKLVRGKAIFALPKGGKTREVPLPDSVANRLRRHAEEFPPMPFTLPWAKLDSESRTVTLFLYTPDIRPVTRDSFNSPIWKAALRASRIPGTRQNGMHVLRHTYASVLLDAGESIKALAAYLGHSDPGFTLRTYTHLLPTSEDRTRRAIDEAFGADGLDDG